MRRIQWAIEAFETDDGATLFVVPVPGTEAITGLTPAERDVASRLVAGQSHAAIAAARGVSVPTVNKQVGSLLRKLRAGNRAELVSALLRAAAGPSTR